MLAQSSFAKFEDLRTRVSKEVTKLEACYKALEDLCNLSSKASMEAKSALRAKVWRAEKEVLPEDTDQPADAQDPTLYLSSQAKPSNSLRIYTSTLGLGILPDLSHIMSKFSHEELAFLQAYWGSQQ